MSRLLVPGEPCFNLANDFGVNGAMILKQLDYWLRRSNNVRDGYKWVYNTYSDWQRQFPFWSEKTIQRVFMRLEKVEIII
jgi:hypothetical protein